MNRRKAIGGIVAALAGADAARVDCVGNDVCDLRVVHDGWGVDSDRGAAFWGRSRGALGAVDHDAGRCDGVSDLLYDREGNTWSLTADLFDFEIRERDCPCAFTAVNTRR